MKVELLGDEKMLDIKTYGNPEAKICIIRLVGEHEKDQIECEISEIKETYSENDWCIVPVQVRKWEDDLAPWAMHATGPEEYKTGAKDTLELITNEIIYNIANRYPMDDRGYYLVGYSLAGLFSLWATYNSDIFSGAAAVSPSVWYPGWLEYIENHSNRSEDIYLSIGSKEHKTRNQMMAKVRDNINKQYDLLRNADINTILEINEGNHFKEPHIRVAKGIKWLIKTKNLEIY